MDIETTPETYWLEVAPEILELLEGGWSAPVQVRATRAGRANGGIRLSLEVRTLAPGPRGDQRIVGYRIRTPAGDVIAKPGDLDVIVFDPQAGNNAYVRRLVTPGE